MTDKSLEDFFAKKGKNKKGKSKSKFATSSTDEIAKRLTETDIKKEHKEKPAPAPPVKDSEEKDKPKDIIGDEDDWRENEEKETDYSGLKIQLQISTNPNQEDDEDAEEELDEFGEPIRSKGSLPSGPWNKLETETDTSAEPAPPPEPIVITSPQVIGGKYVPPGKRGEPAIAPIRFSKKRNKAAPEINNQQEFPSLAASSDIAKHADKNADKNFEKVTRGAASVQNPDSHRPKLDLENRFAALEQN